MEQYIADYKQFYKDKYLISKKKLPCKKCKEPMSFKEDKNILEIYCKNHCNTNYKIEIKEYILLTNIISKKYLYSSDNNSFKEEDFEILKNHIDPKKLTKISTNYEINKKLNEYNQLNSVNKHISQSQDYYKDYLKIYNQKQEVKEKIKINNDPKDIKKYIELNQTMNSLNTTFYNSLKPSNIYL
tara:strand:+ start:93 stop:647 length:555 start_codon:yes stop_codon:yes gene_type:complete